MSVACTSYAGWKRKKRGIIEGEREDSGLTACRSSASGHSIERQARGVVMSESCPSELSTFSNNKRGCPDGRFIDRSSLYMVKDETGMTYLPESNLSSPSHTDLEAKQMRTIPEVPPSPYTGQAGEEDSEEELTRCEVTLPFHLGPGSVGELSDKHTVKSDRNSSNLGKYSSRGSHQSVGKGSQNSVLGSQTGGSVTSRRSNRSGSNSRLDHSDGSTSRKLKIRDDLMLSMSSPLDTDVRMLDGSEHPGDSHSSGARRKRVGSPSGSQNSHSNHSSRHSSHNGSSHSGHNSNHRRQGTNHDKNGHHSNGHRKDRHHHGRRSRHSGDFDHTDSRKRRDKRDSVYSETEPRPPLTGESPTTQGPRHFPQPSSQGNSHDQRKHSKEGDSRSEDRSSRHHNGMKRHSMPNPSSYSNEVFDIGFSGTDLGPRQPIWPGKSPSTEGASDTNSRNSHSSSSPNNRLETTADVESTFSDEERKRTGRHKTSRHKLESAGSLDNDSLTTSSSRLTSAYSNDSSLHDYKLTDRHTGSSSLYSEPSMASPLHTSYLNNRQRPDYMKSVFISDESLARTYSGGYNSAQTSRTTTPQLSHRKLPDTPTHSSGPSSPSKSLTCVPIYSDGAPVDGFDAFEFDEIYANLPGAAPVVYNTQATQRKKSPKTSPVRTPTNGKPDKGEAEKQENIKVNESTEKVDDKLVEARSILNGTKPVPAPRRTRAPRGPLSSASFV